MASHAAYFMNDCHCRGYEMLIKICQMTPGSLTQPSRDDYTEKSSISIVYENKKFFLWLRLAVDFPFVKNPCRWEFPVEFFFKE
jgi:hypothetical protein